MYLKAINLTFRYPKQGEFGFNFCADKVWYLNVDLENKPLGWFLKRGSASIWINGVSSTKFQNINKEFFREYDICDGSEYDKDGSYSTDDLEISTLSLKELLFKSNNYLQICDEINLCVTNTLKNSPIVVFTGKLKKEDLINELKSFYKINNRNEFDNMFTWLVKHRYETDSFNNKKKLISTMIPESKTRGSVQIDIAMADYYNEKMAQSANVNLIDLLPFTDAEIIALFNATATKTFNIVDERAVIAASIFPITEVNNLVKVYVGKIKNQSAGNSFVVIGSGLQNVVTGYVKLDTTNDFGMYRMSCISNINIKGSTADKSIKFNIDSSREICEKVKEHFKDNDGVYGRVTAIPSENINEALQVATEVITNDWNSGIQRVELIPLSDKVQFGNWSTNLTQVIKLNVSKDSIYTIIPKEKPNQEFSHDTLNGFEAAINSLISFENPSMGQLDNTKANNLKLEDRKANIAKRLSFVYDILSDSLKFDWYVALGCPNINRAFIISNCSNEPVSRDRKTATNLNTYIDKSVQSKKNAENICIYSNVENIPYILRLKNVCKTWDKARAVVKSTMRKISHVSSQDVLSRALTAACEEASIPIPEIKSISTEQDKSPKFKFNTKVGPALLDINYLSTFQIFDILKVASLNEMIENDTFLNINNNQNDKLVDPYYCILSVIRDNSSTTLTVIASMYD